MNKIENIESVYYRVKLPQVLTDSTHGEMAYFELVTARITDSDGIEGLGYTYAVNHGGASIQTMINRDLSGHLIGEDPSRIEALWERMWWAVHYPDRGGVASDQHNLMGGRFSQDALKERFDKGDFGIGGTGQSQVEEAGGCTHGGQVA